MSVFPKQEWPLPGLDKLLKPLKPSTGTEDTSSTACLRSPSLRLICDTVCDCPH